MDNESFAKNCIRQAFYILMAERPIECISITDLTNKAGVSRTTFYRLYKTKEDILVDVRDSILVKFAEKVKLLPTQRKVAARALFSYLYENRANLTLFLGVLEHNYASLATKDLIARLGVDHNNSDDYYHFARMGALMSIIIKWAGDGYVQTVDEITEIAADFFESRLIE